MQKVMVRNNMQVVIDIDDKIYETLKDNDEMLIVSGVRSGKSIALNMCNAIRTGTPLPKGHGKLKDTDKISDEIERLRDNWNCYGNEYESGKYEGYDYALDEVLYAPTIIEADKEG